MGDLDSREYALPGKLWKEYNKVSENIMNGNLGKFLEPGSLLKFKELQRFLECGQERESEFNHEAQSDIEDDSSAYSDVKLTKKSKKPKKQ